MHHNHTGHRFAVGYRPVTRSAWTHTVVGIICWSAILGAGVGLALPLINHVVMAVLK